MKTFDRKDIFSWINAEEAKAYIGKKGYMSDSIFGLQEAINISRGYELKDIDKDSCLCFYRPQVNYGRGLFLPVDKVKEVKEPKKYRPFKTCEEFCDALEIDGVGDFIHFRFKDEPSLNYFVIFNGYVEDKEKQLYGVCLGSYTFTIQHLFEHFEYSVEKGKWRPFGVEE